MKKVRCCECERMREPHRPVTKLVDGTILFICHACWKDRYSYDRGSWYLWVPMLDTDRDVLRRLR